MSSLIDLDKPIGLRAFGALVGVTAQTISGHVAAGTLKKGAPLRDWLLCLYASQSSGKGGHSADLATQRARLAKEQADKIERENAVQRGELIPASTAFAVTARCNALINDRVSSLPKRVMLRSKAPDEALQAETEELAAYARHIMATIPDEVLAELADAQSPAS